MRTHLFVAMAITFAACASPPVATDDGGKPDQSDSGTPSDGGTSDGGSADAGTQDGGDPGGITVTCTGPAAPIVVNRTADITCVIDAAGRSVKPPEWSTTPAAGIVLTDLGGGVVRFLLTTNAPGYRHPMGFTDTTHTITAKVVDANTPAIWAVGRTQLTVLGNLWVGDTNAATGGIVAFASDGTYLGYAVGPMSIKNVYSLRAIANGDIVATSKDGPQGAIKAYDLQGNARPVVFAMQDASLNSLFGGYLSGGNSDTRHPRQMAVSSLGELWVTGGGISGKPGIAVYDSSSGALKRWIDTPVAAATHSYVFDAIVRRTDGYMVTASSYGRDVVLFDERTYAPLGPVAVNISTSDQIDSMLALPNEELLFATYDGGDLRLRLIGKTLQVVSEHLRSSFAHYQALELHNGMFLAPATYSSSSYATVFRYALSGATLSCVDNCSVGSSSAPWTAPQSTGLSGIVKLRSP